MSPVRTTPTKSRASFFVREDHDLLSPIINSCPAIQENKENIDMANYELRLLEAFCRGRDNLDAAMPAVMEDILATHCRSASAEDAVTSTSREADPRRSRGQLPAAPQNRSPLPSAYPRVPLQDITGVILNPYPDEMAVTKKAKGQGSSKQLSAVETVWTVFPTVSGQTSREVGHSQRTGRKAKGTQQAPTSKLRHFR